MTKRLLSLLLILLLLLGAAQATEYRTLREGDRGSDVLALKRAMYYLGYFTSLNFGDLYNGVTADRVRQLQRMNGLEETGEADAALQELVFSGQAVPTKGAPKPTAVPTPPPTPIIPQGTPDVPEEIPEGEAYVFADANDGLWIYRTENLYITVRRMREPVSQMVWFEADIQASDASPLQAFLTEGRRFVAAKSAAAQSGYVLAFTDDFFGYRVSQKQKVGIIIRNGKILADKTYRADHRSYPNLEVLAVFNDGSMKAFVSDAHTASEYLEMGAVHTLAFGPILVSEGRLGPHMSDDTYYHYREARCALGMIEPYHYILLVTNGNIDKSKTKGAYMQWLAARMLELGVQEAVNLDGGGTTALFFMGEQLNATGKGKRSISSMIGFGNIE